MIAESLFFESVLKLTEEMEKTPDADGVDFLQRQLQNCSQAFDDDDWFYLSLCVVALSEAKKSTNAAFSGSIRSALAMYALKEAVSSDDVAESE